MSERVALYARVSTDQQEEEQTVQSQLAALRKHAEERGYVVVETYTDEAVSGSVLARPALDRLRDAARSREFDRVLVHSPDRLARKLAYQAILKDEFDRLEVRLEFLNHAIDETPEGQMLFQMQGMFAEYERAKIAERTRRGRRYKAEKGEYMGGKAPFGYRYVPKDGSQPPTIEPDPETSPVVREMFRLLIEEKLSCSAIASRLAERGIPTARGGMWRGSTIHRMLKHPAYKGEAAFGRWKRVAAKTRDGRRRYSSDNRTSLEERPQDEWVNVPVPAIVDEAIWNGAQEQLRLNALRSPRNNKRHTYLLRSLLRCASCGHSYTGRHHCGTRRYYCRGSNVPSHSPKPRCKAPSVRGDELEVRVWETLAELLRHPDRITDEYRQRLNSDAAYQAWEEEIRECERTLQKLSTQEDRLLSLYAEGDDVLSKDALTRKMSNLAQQRRHAEAKQEQLANRRRDLEGQEAALASLARFAERIRDGLDQLDFEQKREVLLELVDYVEVRAPNQATLYLRLPEEDPINMRHLHPQHAGV